MRRTLLPLLFVAFAAASCSEHPLHGAWHQHVADGHGIEIEFDSKSDKVIGHGPGGDHTSHAHMNGTYTFTGDAVEISGAWDHTRETVHWKGRVQGDTLTLQGKDGTLEFHRGDAH